MGKGETQVNIQISEAAQMEAVLMNFQQNSSVNGNASPLAESEACTLENQPENSDRDDDVNKKKTSITRKKYIIIFIYSTLLACITGLLTTSFTADKLKNSMIWEFKLWKWWLLLAIMICGGLCTYLLIEAVDWLIIKFRPNEKVLYYFPGVKKSVVVFIWLCLIFVAWFLLFDHKIQLSKENDKIVNHISRGLGGCVIGAAIWLVKTSLVKLVASFHVKTLLEKLRSANHRCKILQSISKNKKKKVDDASIGDLFDVIKAKELPLLCYGHQDKEIIDENGARDAANEIFKSFALPDDERFANLTTILELLEDEEEKQHFIAAAEDTEKGLSGNEENDSEDKRIKRSIFRNWVVDIFRQYDSMNSTLKNKKTAVDELNRLASVIILVIIIIVWLLVMELLSTKTLVFIGSQLLLVVFMFGNTAKTIFEAIIFVFVMHPFDVGDRCVVEGVQMIVDEMEIMTTTFLKHDGERIYYPNSVLATNPISNLFRSPNMSDSFEFTIDFSTPRKTLEDLQEEIKKYLESNPRRWGDHSLQFLEIENMNKLKLALYFSHKINFHDAGRRGKRRSILVLDMKEIFEKLNLKYNLLPQPVYLSYSNGATT